MAALFMISKTRMFVLANATDFSGCKVKNPSAQTDKRNPSSRAFCYGCWVHIASGSAFGHGPKLVGTMGLWHWQVQPRIWQVDHLPFVVSDIGSLHEKLSCLQGSFHKLRELLAVYLNKVINTTNGTNKVHCRKAFGPSGETQKFEQIFEEQEHLSLHVTELQTFRLSNIQRPSVAKGLDIVLYPMPLQ